MMDRIFDLPAHPLVVHFPVVAIPVLALLTLGIAFSPTIRRKYGHFTVALGVVTAVSTFLATMSGDSLAADSEEFKGLPAFLFDDHKALGEQTRLMVFGLLLVLLLLMYVAPRIDTSAVTYGAAAVAVVLAVTSTIWVVRTGHSGAKSHWGGFYPAEETQTE